ncbi:MAG: SMI1/KNR4 family protein [Mycobacteriaceae bacterium]
MEVASAESLLSVRFPERLRELYVESDGRFSESGQWWVVWPLERLVEDNQRAWSDLTLSRQLLAFGDDGTGAPFCVALNSDAGEVLRWNWLDQDVEVNEGDMAQFLRVWLDGA